MRYRQQQISKEESMNQSDGNHDSINTNITNLSSMNHDDDDDTHDIDDIDDDTENNIRRSSDIDDDEMYEDEDEDEYDAQLLPLSLLSDEHSSRRLQHIRSIYQCITFPILPCIFLTMLSYIYFLYTAFLLDHIMIWWWWWWYHSKKDNPDMTMIHDSTHLQSSSSSSSSLSLQYTASGENEEEEEILTTTSTPSCRQSLRVYAYISVIIVVYMYHHCRIRTWIWTRIIHRPLSGELPSQQTYIVPFAQQRYDQIVYSLIIVYICVGLSFVQSCRNATNN